MLPAGNASNEVHVGGGDPLGLEPELVSEEQAEEDWDGDIVGDEGGSVPVTLEENTPVGKENEDDIRHNAPISGKWHEIAVPWEVLGIETVGLQSLSEPDASTTDAEPVEHS